MRNRCSVAVAMLAALAGLAAFAPPAGASSKHFRMLAFKPCDAVLVAPDFLDDLQEVAPTSVNSAGGTTADVSVCKYAATEESGGGLASSFTNGGLGVECLANLFKLLETGNTTPPPGGCWRIDNASVLFAYGRPVERLAAKLQKGTKATHWPSQFGRHVLPGVGDRAEFGYDTGTGDGYGYVQLDNATLFVETTEGANPSLITLLRDGASVL